MLKRDEMRGGGRSAVRAVTGRGIGGREGFTILQLMIGGVVIGILAGIAVPIYWSYLKRARQVEAPVALTEIKRLEAMYFAFNSGYGSLEEIGYHPGTSLRYYAVTMELIPDAAGPKTGFTATATGNLDSDPDEDVWTMSQDGILRHPSVD